MEGPESKTGKWDAGRYEWWRGLLAELATALGFVAATLVVAIKVVWDSDALPWIAVACAVACTACLVGIPVLSVVERYRLHPDGPLRFRLGASPFAIVALCLLGFVIGGFVLPASSDQAAGSGERYATRLNSVLADLRRESAAGLEKLGDAPTASTQREAARELSRSFGAGADRLRRASVGNRLRRSRQRLIQRLEAAREACRSIRAAAGPSGSQGDLDAARSAMAAAMVTLRHAVNEQKRLVT